MVAEVVHSLVLQSHAVEHSRRCLSHSGIVVSLTRLQSRAFYDDAAYLVEAHEVGVFQSVTECAGGCHHRILQPEPVYSYT